MRRKTGYIMPAVVMLVFLMGIFVLHRLEEQGRMVEPVMKVDGAAEWYEESDDFSGNAWDNGKEKDPDANAEDPLRGNTTALEEPEFPVFTEEVLLCSDVVKKLYDHQIDVETAIQTDDPYRTFAIEYDMGSRSGTFYLSENRDLSDAREYAMESFETVFRIDNLKTGTQYYYKAVIEEEEYTGSFKTAASPRLLSIPGAVNVRDIGGYKNQDGKMVRQGLLVRGTEIDGLETSSYKILDTAVDGVQKDFGFVYDFDLRRSIIYNGQYQSPLGKNVKHAFYSSPQYEQIFEAAWRQNIKQIFTDLADPAKYPMYMHCAWGKDRTGTIVYLLQGVLNMSEEDMMREYLLSGFAYSEMAEENAMIAVVERLNRYKGSTLQEKIVSYLMTDVGITAEQIESIRTIFLE